METKKSQLQVVEQEYLLEIKANPKALNALLETTFKGFSPDLMQKAIFEGMLRGFKFIDFLQKDVYAIPYGNSYSLVSSIDFARKIAMRSGLAGKSAPTYQEGDNGPVSCTITVKRNANGLIGEYTATVFFNEYNTGKNLWIKMPRTMIAKVAEMHALRSAFPEEMAKQYITEEMQKPVEEVQAEENFNQYEAKIKACKSVEEIKKVWASMPLVAKNKLKELATSTKEALMSKELPIIEEKVIIKPKTKKNEDTNI
jgi:hypothetical protein